VGIRADENRSVKGGVTMSREELKAKGYTDDEIEEIIMIYESEMQYENTNDNIMED